MINLHLDLTYKNFCIQIQICEWFNIFEIYFLPGSLEILAMVLISKSFEFIYTVKLVAENKNLVSVKIFN